MLEVLKGNELNSSVNKDYKQQGIYQTSNAWKWEDYKYYKTMATLAQIKKKYQQSSSFQKEMKKAEANYQILHQRAYYSCISDADTFFMQKFKGKTRMDIDIHFIYASYQNIKASTLDKLTLSFIAKLPKPTRFYMLVYFNDEQFSDAFPDIKTVLQILPVQYYINLVKIFIVKPTFREKASRYFVFGTIPKFINAQIENVENLKQLSQHLGTDISQIVRLLPPDVKSLFLDELKKQKNKKQQPQVSNFNNQIQHSHTMPHTNNKHTQAPMGYSKPQLKKPQVRKFEIDQYNKTQNGLPQVFQILVFYFKEHPQGTKQQGIFRKSASIIEQDQAIDQLSKKQFDCIDKIDNAHIVANLIKRFLRDLASPIIPYNIFYNIMNEPVLTPQFMSAKIKELSATNMTKLLTLMFLIQFLLSDIIAKSSINKMTADNIAIVFAPCIMWAKQRSYMDLMYATKSVQALSVIIKNFQFIFGTPKDQKRLYRSSYLEHRKKWRETALNLPQPKKQQAIKQLKKKSSQQDSDDDYSQIKLNPVSKYKQNAKTVQKAQQGIKTIQQKEISNVIASKIIKKGIFTSKLLQKMQQKRDVKQTEPEQKVETKKQSSV